MKKLALGLIAAATVAAPLATSPADAQYRSRDWHTYQNYDYNQPPGSTYYADQYYRSGRYYQERRLSRNDRIYRGRNGRYYCRRSDGTTGLIVGGAVGGLIGNALSSGRSEVLGTLLGVGAGAALGSSIDRGNVRCR
jgi:Ni/Co efflux regulator RcnB